MVWTFKTLAAVLISSAVGASLDVNDPGAIAMAHQAAAANLLTYYKPNDKGTIPAVESEGRDGFQWFEMGMLWGAMMDYTNVSKNHANFNTIGQALGGASFGKAHSFIGPKVNGEWKTAGFWNDDIGWWSFAAISGAEIKGKDAKMPNGITFLQLAQTTWEQINEQLSNQGTCSGGVFWYRDRNSDKPNRARLFATVSSLQYAFLSARLYMATGQKSYLEAAQRTYDWAFRAKLIDAEGRVFDGTYAPKCWQIEKKEHSYNSGLFLGVAGLLHKATGDNKYIQDATVVLKRSQVIFADKNGVIIDECEPGNSCKVNQAAFKGIFVRGLGSLYTCTNDVFIQSAIKKMILSSVEGMVKTCTDDWACNNIWTNGSQVYSDVHTQNTALELFNTFFVIVGRSKNSTEDVADPTKPNTGIIKPANNVSVGELEDIFISGSIGIASRVSAVLSFALLIL